MKQLFDLFFTFARIGAVTFGGGYAMLPILQREIAEKRAWATEDELLDYYAIGQCTPGIIAVNVATFIGYKNKGVGGAIAATLGLICPSLIIIMIIAAFVQGFSEYEAVKNAFCGIRVCVCVLVFDAVYKLWKKAVVDKSTLVVFLTVLALSLFTSVSVAVLVVLAGISGVVISKVKGMVNKK